MFWNYTCPECRRPAVIEWRLREGEVTCRLCGRVHYPPTPHEDRYAYVDELQWPPEVEEAVLALRGTICSVPNCYHEHTTLVLRQPAGAGGRTSVDNLLPMCARHAASKGNRNYDEWLAEIRQEDAKLKQDEPKLEITITTREPAPDLTAPDFPAPSGMAWHLASYRALAPARPSTPHAQPLVEQKLVVPFLRGAANRVAFNYDWSMKKSGRCRVFLAAWPRGDEPDISQLGGPKFAGRSIAKDHLGVKDDAGNNELELTLPTGVGGRWTAAVALLDEGCQLELTEYALATLS